MTHIAIIEPTYYARMAYVEYLSSFPAFAISFAVPSPDDVSVRSAIVARQPVDILIYSLSQTDESTFTYHYRQLRQQFAHARVIVISDMAEPGGLAALLKLGIHGHVMRSHRMNSLMEALEEVRQGAAALCGQSVLLLRRYFCEGQRALPAQCTPREKELLSLVCSGASIQHIADTLLLSTTTVNYHLQKLYKKFKVGSRAQLMAAAGQMVEHDMLVA